MTKRIIPIVMLGAAALGLNACKSGGEVKQYKGIEYQIVKDAKGKNAQIGDIIEFNLIAKADTAVLNDTWKMGRPGVQRVDSVRNAGDLQAVFPFLSAGDSAVVTISCDTILKNIPAEQMSNLPPWLKKGNKVTINISVISVKSEAEYNKEMEAKQAEEMKKAEEQKAAQLPLDDKTLQEYFAKNNIKAEKTASGLYYVVNKPGSGPAITTGQEVSMMYTGKLLDGTIFDSNADAEVAKKNGHDSKPLTFIVGMHQMIPGVDEGAGLLKKGAKATLYLPSPLAYGPNSPNPAIPANSIMIFEVEITDVKAGQPAPPAPNQ